MVIEEPYPSAIAHLPSLFSPDKVVIVHTGLVKVPAVVTGTMTGHTSIRESLRNGRCREIIALRPSGLRVMKRESMRCMVVVWCIGGLAT